MIRRSLAPKALGPAVMGVVLGSWIGPGCGRTILDLDTDGDADASTSGMRPDPDTGDRPVETTGPVDEPRIDMGDDRPQCGPGEVGCTNKLDVLIVVDNSRSMARPQGLLARAAAQLVESLANQTDAAGDPLALDVQVMVTTTDISNPSCVQYEPPGYDPAFGHPISTACIDRLQDFADIGGTVFQPEACTKFCPVAVTPSDSFVAFGPDGDNVGEGAGTDVDSDGQVDLPAAQAVACLVPQGINGCGYESPLQAMRFALDPGAAWNEGPRPFLRPDAALAIVVLTDEADCSIADPTVMTKPAFQNIDPTTGLKGPSSAICWNAGVECDGPDANGIYASCWPSDGDEMQPVDLYVDVLTELRTGMGKTVTMLEIVGVPPVTMHDPDPPFEPTAGGADALIYREWVDGPWPAGDLSPDEFEQGVTALYKRFEYGIGPGCAHVDPLGKVTHAVPPVRLREVCERFDELNPSGGLCCIESICENDYRAATRCIEGMWAGVRQGPFVPGGD